MKTTSLSKRLSIYIIGASAALLLVSVGLITLMSFKFMSNAAITDAANALERSVNKIEARISRVEGNVDGGKWGVMRHISNPEYMPKFTREFLSSSGELYGSAIAFVPWFYPEKGEYYSFYSYRTAKGIRTIPFGEEYEYFSSEWFKKPLELRRPYWSEPYFDEGGGEVLMSTYSVPLMTADSTVYAIMTADITLTQILKVVTSVRPYENSYTFLCSNEGVYISHTDPDKCFKETIYKTAERSKSPEFRNAVKRMMSGENGNARFNVTGGERCFIVYHHLSNGWCMGTIIYEKDVFATVKWLQAFMIIVMILGLALLYLTSRRIIKRQTRPLEKFSAAAMNIANGDFNTALPAVDTGDEIGQLHDSMEFMLKSINSYISELDRTTAAKHRIENELHIASAIQLAMLPHTFKVNENVKLFADLHPAKEVGGDLYDYAVIGNSLYFIVGDVSGKGIPAALYMAICSAAFRLVSGMGISVDEIVSRINNTCALRNESNMFATMFVGKINLDTLEMEFCNAGHNPIIVVDASGARFLKVKPNLAVGLFADFPYQKECVQLARGSRLLIYTDGVSEAETASKELYGDDRLLAYAAKAAGNGVAISAEDFVRGLLDDVREFTSGNPQNDDITMMSVTL